jgi:hypothetical protein
MHPISLNPIILRINFHLGHHIIELHILLSNLAAVLNRFDSFLEVIGGDCARGDGGGGDEENGG